jgi:hypothetical protein
MREGNARMTVRPTGLLSPRSGTRIPVPGSDLYAVIRGGEHSDRRFAPSEHRLRERSRNPQPQALRVRHSDSPQPAVVMDSGLAGCVGAGLKPAPTCILQPDSTNEISVYSLILSPHYQVIT